MDNIEVVVLLRVEGTDVYNLHFLLILVRLKTLSRVSKRRDILASEDQGHPMCPKPQWGWRFSFRISIVPTYTPRFLFIQDLNRLHPLPPCCAFYSREDVAPCMAREFLSKSSLHRERISVPEASC